MLKRLFTLFCLLFSALLTMAQPVNDDCENATELCNNVSVSGTTTGATLEQCLTIDPNGCADDNGINGFCYVPAATVWYKFTTNSTGGSVTVNFTNLSINPDPTMGRKLHAVMIQSDVPCEGGNYSYVSQCFNNGLTDFSLTDTTIAGLAPNTTYYIQVDGSGAGPGVTQSAQIDFDISVSGPGVVAKPLSVKISADETAICQYDQVAVDFEFTNCTGAPNFEWFFNGELSGTDAVFLTSNLTESGHLYLKGICGTDGCPITSNSDSIFFDVTPIEVDAGPDQLIEIGGAVMLEGSGIGSPRWTPSNSLTRDDVYMPISSVDSLTEYTLTVTNGSCTLTDQMLVFLKSPVNIPSGFTPNNDGRNDFWEIEFLEQYEDNQVIVYDRSGQVVFKTVGYNNGSTSWDGTYKDNPVPPSTYFYFIDLRDGRENSIFRGPVTVIR